MKKISLLLLLISGVGLFLPLSSEAQQKVPVSTENVLTINYDPTTKGCVNVGEPDKNGKVQVDKTTADQPLVRLLNNKDEINNNASVGISNSFLDARAPTSLYLYFSCPRHVFAKIAEDAQELNIFGKITLQAMNTLLWFIDSIAEALIAFFGNLLVSMIKQGSYINHVIVKEAWPFIQGVANLGFIFVLLYIALATTLRMEAVGTSVQRLLPKLLIGALLVNFSLVVGGLLIDTSRVIMAAEMRLMSGGEVTPDKLPDKLLERSRAVEGQVNAFKSSSGAYRGGFWATALRLIQGSAFRVLLAAAFGVVAINLFVRYIALIVLLIFSPIPYLAFILPKTKGISDHWWGMFLKWVFYGPIVLFFLIIITQIQNIDVATSAATSSENIDTAAFKEFVKFIIIVSLFFVANTVGKKFAGVGSDAVMSFAAKNKRAAAIGVAALGSGGLALPVAAGVAALTSRSARDAYSGVGSNIVKRARGTELFGKDTKLSKAAKFIAGPERDSTGKLKDGQESVGSMLADRLPFSTSTEGKAAINAVNKANIPKIDLWDPRVPGDDARYNAEVTAQQTKIDTLRDSKDLSAAKLMKKSTANALSKDQINMIMKHGSVEQQEALATHKDVVRKMGDDVKGHISAGLIGNADIKRKVDSRLRDLANKE